MKLKHIAYSVSFLTALFAAPIPSYAFDVKDIREGLEQLHDLHKNIMNSDKSAVHLSRPIIVKEDGRIIIGSFEFGEEEKTQSPTGTLSINITPPKLPAFRSAPKYNGGIVPKTLMLQANYDFSETNYGTPFVNAGVGFTGQSQDDFEVTSNFENIDAQNDDFIIEAGGGLQIPIDEDVSIMGAYRFLDTEDTDLEGADLDIVAHEFRVGLTFKLVPPELK